VVEAGYIVSFTLEINSETLQTGLRRIINMDSFRDVRTVDGTMIITYPFRSLFHGRNEIKQAIAKAKTGKLYKLKEELTLLQDFLLGSEALGDIIRELDSLISRGK
jgi:hypothetical protein